MLATLTFDGCTVLLLAGISNKLLPRDAMHLRGLYAVMPCLSVTFVSVRHIREFRQNEIFKIVHRRASKPF